MRLQIAGYSSTGRCAGRSYFCGARDRLRVWKDVSAAQIHSEVQGGSDRLWTGGRRTLTSVAAAPSSQTPQVQRPQPRVVGDWKKLRELQNSGESINVTLEKVNRTGAIFELHGANGFVPYSFMDFTRLPGDHDGMALDYLVGKSLTVKLVRVDEGQNQLVGSELAFLTQQLAAKLEEGDVVEGVVSQCRDFGAFVRLGSGKTLQGVEGLIHISELSWNKIFTPEAVVQPGMFVRCRVLSADPKEARINLSLKRMEPDPLEERLDTIFDGLDAEKVAVVPTEVPSTIEDVLTALECQEGVQSVSLGRQAEEKRAVSQDLEVWMSTAKVEGGCALVVRAGRLVQEVIVKTDLPIETVRNTTAEVLKELARR